MAGSPADVGDVGVSDFVADELDPQRVG